MDAKSVVVGSVKSKTQWVGAIVVALGIIVDNAQLVGQLIPPEYMGKVMSGLGLLFMFLRTITGTSLAEKAAPKEGGFVRLELLAVLAAVALLFGCASAKSFEDELLIGYGTVTEIRNGTTTVLNAKRINSNDAENVLKQTDEARAGLDIARALRSGQPAEAEAKLTVTQTILRALKSYLITKLPAAK